MESSNVWSQILLREPAKVSSSLNRLPQHVPDKGLVESYDRGPKGERRQMTPARSSSMLFITIGM